jgi:HEAT repeat protein
VLTPSQLVGVLLVPAFLLVFVTWAGASAYLLIAGVRNGQRALALGRARRALAAITVADCHDEELRTAVVSLMATLPDDVVLPLASGTTHRPSLDRVVAEAAVARIGRPAIEALAGERRPPKDNWRRIAAMRLLAAGSPASTLVPLLTRALDDDPEIVGASLAVLGRLEDRAAGLALIGALKDHKYAPSRIATYLDQSPAPIADALVPLLHHPDAQVRYWGATLMARHRVPGVERDVASLTKDASPLVRKAAVATLAEIDSAGAVGAVQPLLEDPIWYVRAHAARALATAHATDTAEQIAPLLADREWWVRLAARESLQQMGEEIWSVLVPYLDHADGFARNGAAEVLQNIGVLDSLIVLEAATSRPSASKVEMLRKIAAAGGTRMTEALLERVDENVRPRVRSLLTNLGLERTEVRS